MHWFVSYNKHFLLQYYMHFTWHRLHMLLKMKEVLKKEQNHVLNSCRTQLNNAKIILLICSTWSFFVKRVHIKINQGRQLCGMLIMKSRITINRILRFNFVAQFARFVYAHCYLSFKLPLRVLLQLPWSVTPFCLRR